MVNSLGDPLRLPLHRKPVPRAAITMSPSEPAESGDQTILAVITVHNILAGASVVLTQSGDLIDADFDDTLINTVAAAAAATSGVTFNVGTRRLTFAGNFSGAFTFLRTIISDPAVGKTYILTLSAPLGGMTILIPNDTFVTSVAQPPIPPPTGPVPLGMNLASGEFGTTATGALLNSTYTYPTAANATYFRTKGIERVRIPFKWNRVQPTISGALSEPDMAALDSIVNAVIAAGDIALLDMHEFQGRRPTPDVSTVTLGIAPVTTAALADLWIRISERYSGAANDARVHLGLFNEPQGPTFTAAEWAALLVPTLVDIRAAGVTKTIHIPGAFWSGAHSWVSSGNAAAFEASVLPNLPAGGPYVVDVHQYLDSDSSGGSPVATPGAGSTRLVAYTDWARVNLVPLGIKSSIGEAGFANNPGMITELRALMDYTIANIDVWESVYIWSAGPWWNTSYMYLVEPSGGYANPIDRPQMAVLLDYSMPIAVQQPITDISLSNSISTGTAIQGVLIGTLRAVDANDEDYHTFVLTDTAGDWFQLVGNQVQVGSAARTIGVTKQITVVATDRGGNTFPKVFSMPVVAAPLVSVVRVGTSIVDEGQNFVFRFTITGPVPATGFDFWCSGDVPAEMSGTLETACRATFEAKGCTVQRMDGSRMRIRMGNTTPAGTIDVTWQTLADAQTEGSNFQANFFMDTPIGCTLGSSVVTYFIRDTSLTPGWAISVGAGSVFPGGTVSHRIELANPAVGAKVTITPSGVANDADFTATFDSVLTAACALETGLTYNAGTNELEVTGAWDGVLLFDREVDIDDDDDETYIVTLSGAVASVISAAAVTVLIRQQQGTATVTTINYAAGESTDTTALTSLGVKQYRNADESWSEVPASALCLGDRGLRLGAAATNLFRNPRAVGGTAGTTTKPTGWGLSTSWTFVGAGSEGGVPYADFTRNYTVADTARVWTFGAVSDITLVGAQMLAVKFGFKVLAGTFPPITVGARAYSASSAPGAQSFSASFPPGPNRVWLEKTVVYTASTAATYLQPQVQFPPVGAIGVVTIRIYAPSVRAVPLFMGTEGAIPVDTRFYPGPLPPAGTIAVSATDVMAVDLDIIPPEEGTFILDFDSEARYGNECLISLYSDENNFIEVRHMNFGALGLYVSVNGSLVVELDDPITETAGGYISAGYRHKLELIYGLFDVRLILDGRQLCAGTPTTLPVINAVRIGRDRNGVNYANMYLRRLTYRDDVRDTTDALIDTGKPGILESPGVNMAGGEFGNWLPGVNRIDYFFSSATPNSKSAGAAYWADKCGPTLARVPFNWPRAQPELFGALDTTSDVGQGLGTIGYMGLLDAQINDWWSVAGIQSIPDMHDFSVYKVNSPGFTQVNAPIGTAPVTVAAWVDAWEKLTLHWLGNPAIRGFDIMNEPSTGASVFLSYFQQVINAIAAIDPDRKIYLEGKFFSAASRWPLESNFLKDVTHPNDINNIIFSAHLYMDANGSGTYQSNYPGEDATPETAVFRCLPFVQWRLAQGIENRRAHIGEYGWPNNSNTSSWALAGSNGIKFMHENNLEVSAWLAGEGAGNNNLNIEPTGGVGAKVDRPQMIAQTRHKYQGTGLAQTFDLSPSFIVSASSAGTLVGNVTASDGGVITGLTLIDTVGNRFALDGLALEAGAVATNFATAQQHVVVLNGLIDGVPTTGSLTITVTQVPTAPAIFVLSAGDDIVSGSPAGTLVSPVVSDTGAPVTSLAITDTAGDRFAVSGNNLVAGAVATDYDVATSHSITLEGLIGGVSRTQVFPSIDVTPAPAAREFFISASSILEGSAQGTLVGLVQSNDGVVANLTLTDSAGNRFQIGAGNRLEAGSVATSFAAANQHSITLDGLIGGVASSTTLLVNVTAAAPGNLILISGDDEIVAGSPPGTVIMTWGASSGTLTNFTLTNNAGNRFAASGNNVVAGSVVTTYPNEHSITIQGLINGVSKSLTFVILVTPPAAAETYLLSAMSIQSGAAQGTFIGTFSGSGGGALTGLSLTQTAGNRFALSGNNLVAGAVATNFTTANSHLITLTGSIGGVARTQNFTITVNSTGFGLENLGKVRAGAAYPAQPWDMIVFDGKLWFGTGNSASSGAPGPNQNAGSGDLFYWNLVTDTLVNSTYTAAEINDEQISQFRIIDGQLLFSGIDPRTGSPIYFHRLESGVWNKHSVGSFNHCFDVYKFNNKWFASTGTDTALPPWDIFRKTDVTTGIGGWADTQISSNQTATRGSTFFEHSGNLYCGLYQNPGLGPDGFSAACAFWNGSTFTRAGAPGRSVLFPGFSPYNQAPGVFMRVERPVNIGTSLVYIGGRSNNDSHWNGVALFVATASFASVTRITLLTSEVPWDLIARGSTVYVLTSRLKSSGPQVFEIRVLSSTNLTTWTEVLKFDQPTHARSFEEYNGDWYFGLGTDRGVSFETASEPSYTDTIKAESGTLLRWTPAAPPDPPADVEVVIDLLDTKQVMQGFGSSERVFTDPHVFNNFNSATGEALTVLTQAQKNEIYDKLYVDLKLTRVRPIQDGPASIEPVNDNADPLVANAAGFNFGGKRLDYHITWVQAAIARGVDTYWLSPQYPFESWLGSATDKNEYAEWAMQQLLRFQAAGLEMPYFSLINEPAFSVTGAWIRDTIKILGPRMRSAGLDTMIVVPDDVRSTESTSRATTILADAAARAYVGALATHLYDQSVSNVAGMQALATTYGLPLWMTEFSIFGMPTASLPGTAFEWAKLIHNLIATYDVTAVDYMWAAFGEWTNVGASLIRLNNSGATYLGYVLQKQYYMTGQYSRFVPPGAIRVDAVSDDATILATAYKDGTDIAIVAINNSGQSKTVQFSGLGAKASVSATRTSTTEDWAVLSAIAVAGGAFTATLTPNSVTTFTA